MGYYCTVPQCTSLAGKTKNVKFHRFPRDVAMADKWNTILKRGKPYTKYSKVCSLHFTQADYNVTTMGQWKTLSKDAVPSQNLPKLNPDGSVMVIRKSRTVKYRDGRKDSIGERSEKWCGTPQPMSHSGLPTNGHIPEHETNAAYRLQTLSAIASTLPPQGLPPRPRKQDAFMQTDPIQSEDDDLSQPNNSYSEASDTSFNSEQHEYQKGYISQQLYQKEKEYVFKDEKFDNEEKYGERKNYTPKPNDYSPKADNYSPKPDNYSTKADNYSPRADNYPKPESFTPKPDDYSPRADNYPKPESFTPKPGDYSPSNDNFNKPDNYTPKPDNYPPKPDNYPPKPDNYPSKPENYSKEDYIPQTNEEYNKEAEKYALERKSLNGYDKSMPNYHKHDYPKHDYQKIPENGYQMVPDYLGYTYPTDSVEMLRNQQQNLGIIQQQHRLNENQNFFNDNHIKQEIDMNTEEDKFIYERAKEQLDANLMYTHRTQQQRLLEHLTHQVKQEPDIPVSGCDGVLPQGSPYYPPGPHNAAPAGLFEPRPGPELLIAKQNALAAHTQLWQNTMKRPFFYSESPSYTSLHRYEDLTRILQ